MFVFEHYADKKVRHEETVRWYQNFLNRYFILYKSYNNSLVL